jgi:hypothetical protein
MKVCFDEFLIYDIFETLSKYLSVQDIVNVLTVNKSVYDIYKYSENYCNKIFVTKIIQYFGFELVFNKINSIKHLFRMFYYFKNHNICYTADFLVYMIDNSIKDVELFRFYASQCYFRDIITNKLIKHKFISINHKFISINHMKYILANSDTDQLDVIFSLFNVD